MIDEEVFKQKLREVKSLRVINLTEGIAEAMYSRLKRCHPADFTWAIEDVIQDQQKFDFARLKMFIDRRQAVRLESQGAADKEREKRAAQEFFDASYPENCKWKACLGCSLLDRCTKRGNEWIGGIKSVLNTPKAAAKKRSEEVIAYMKCDYLGGIIGATIKAHCDNPKCPSFSHKKNDWEEFDMLLTAHPNACPACGKILY